MTLLPKLVSKGINPFLYWLVIFWTFAISSNLIWNIAANLYTAVENVLIHTKKSFEKDLLVHRCNASQDGVYVPIIEKTHLKPVCLPFQKEKLLHHLVGS